MSVEGDVWIQVGGRVENHGTIDGDVTIHLSGDRNIGDIFINQGDVTGELHGYAELSVEQKDTHVIVALQYNGGTDADGLSNKRVCAEKEMALSFPVITQDGYVLAGWYTDSSLQQPYQVSTKVAENMTLYAKWTANSYTITFDTDGGTDVASQTVKHGGTAEKPADPTRSRYDFDGWFLNGEKFDFGTPIAGDITLTAQWSKESSGSSGGSSSGYTVSVDSGKHGSVTVSPKSAKKGTTVTITVKPDKGCELDDLTVTDKDGDELKLTKKSDTKYTFTMPASKVEVEATFVKIEEEAPEQTFIDVPDGYWAEDAIAWAYENGYMNGNTAVTFNPEGTVSRQQLWMILARLSGYNPATMAEAKSWAVDNGISDGTAPGGAVSRQQLVTILYRYAVRMGYQTDRTADLTVYPDHAGVAAYAKDAMSWSVANSIVGGTTQGTLNPSGTATRAQFAVILQRFVEHVM